MIDLSKYRIIDLSYEMVPGEQRIDGQYLHGVPTFCVTWARSPKSGSSSSPCR